MASSRWGSFLTGLESKLDNILADEDPKTTRQSKGNEARQEPRHKNEITASTGVQSRGDSPSRSAAAGRAQDRLNERLAKAVANRNVAKKADYSVTSSEVPSRTTSPANAAVTPRLSSDSNLGQATDQKNTVQEPLASDGVGSGGPSGTQPESFQSSPQVQASAGVGETNTSRLSMDSHASTPALPSTDLIPTTTQDSGLPVEDGPVLPEDFKSPEEYKQILEQMQADYETSELRRQEETHDYLERIDALQAKLQYLTKEAAAIAKTALSEASPGGIEHSLAAKDEKIALLLEEGHKLSQTELKHMSIIKKLRAKATEDDNKLADSKRTAERHEKVARDLRERVKRAEAAERRIIENSKTISQLEKELDSVRNDRDAKAALVQDLQSKISDATWLAREEESKAQEEALTSERKAGGVLKEELLQLKSEREVSERQHQSELRSLRDNLERTKERTRLAEIEQQGEHNILESRLETLRARLEEASTGTSGDVQAKLLRQIETLQTQYAVANENWQGIEGSLIVRIAAVEKERDDIAKREADVRRKAREANIKSRSVEDELERITSESTDIQLELKEHKSQISTLQAKVVKAEEDAAKAHTALTAEREARDLRQAQLLEEEKARHAEESTRTPDSLYHHFHVASPSTYSRNRKDSNENRVSPHTRRPHGLAISAPGHPSPHERPLSRRSSGQPLQISEVRPLSRQESYPFVPQLSVNGGVPQSPSLGDQQEDFFDGVRTPATPERAVNDIISVSTAGAGPSVQLVERMSAAVRRLESEKAATKDELARFSAQRDEAREQVVILMKEAEGKRASDEKICQLEAELQRVNKQYLNASEMLGEKLERVEELEADVQELKHIYRELVERTVR